MPILQRFAAVIPTVLFGTILIFALVQVIPGGAAEEVLGPEASAEMVQVMLEKSGLILHYQTEKEGADRIENLEQLVAAATVFVSEEGFGMDAPALVKHIAASPAAQHSAATKSFPLVKRMVVSPFLMAAVMLPRKRPLRSVSSLHAA